MNIEEKAQKTIAEINNKLMLVIYVKMLKIGFVILGMFLIL